MRKLIALLVIACLAAAATAAPADDPKTYTVKVGDDFFSPTKRTIHRKDIVKWVWVGENGKPGSTVNQHTITERDGKLPSLVSKAKTSGTYRFRFKKVGKFVILCAEHPDAMKLTVKVKE